MPVPILPFLILGGILAFAGPRRQKRDWMDESGRKPPTNLSGNQFGYNQQAFSGPFAIKLAFTFLGYDVDLFKKTPEGVVEIINPAIVVEFQKDYNAISSMGVDELEYKGLTIPNDFGYVETDGDIGPATLNALEHAINWARISAIGGLWQNVAYEARARAYY